MLLLVAALLLAQGLNAYFLLGERRVVARATHYATIINRMVEARANIPPTDQLRLPHVLVQSPQFGGSIFISRHNRAMAEAGGRPARRQAKQLRQRMEDAGFPPLDTAALVRDIEGPPTRDTEGSADNRRPNDPVPNANPGNATPPVDRFGNTQPRPLPPPDRRPPHQAGSSGLAAPPDELFHPPVPPDPSGTPGPGFEEIVLSAEITPGIWLNAMAPHYATEAISARAIFTTLLSIAIAAIAASVLANRIAKPIGIIGAAAEALGRGDGVRSVPETGPRDVRTAARSFNVMQARLTRLIDDQRATLRAIGHDLRTPLTSLRIRAEDLSDTAEREKFITMIDDLSATTGEILSWAKDISDPETPATIDLSALLDTIAEDYRERGLDVSFIEPASAATVACRRVGLKRAVINLLDNALKFAGQARISLRLTPEHVEIHIDDDGPGIPADRLAEVTKPFIRLETSRNRQTGGTGLGLSITQSLIHSHGGALTLANRAEGGLRATIQLPLHAG